MYFQTMTFVELFTNRHRVTTTNLLIFHNLVRIYQVSQTIVMVECVTEKQKIKWQIKMI